MITAVKNKRGTALIETLPILMVFTVLLGFSLGFFTFVHTAILNSIASRTYAFETFRNRADLTMFRDTTPTYSFAAWHARFHTIDDESRITATSRGTNQYATARNIDFSRAPAAANSASENDQNIKIYEISGRNRNGVKASPAWVMVGYGICLDAGCGD